MKKYNGSIDMIHPTQCTVGYAEVAVKMEELSKYEKNGELAKYLKSKEIPCVLGPDNIIYITDHHHMGLALTILAAEWQEENPKKAKEENPFIKCTFSILYDFSKSNLPKKEFFKVLDSLHFVHKYDENGQPQKYGEIPKRLIDLKNDHYRSLAGFVRKSGGYKKIDKPYLEFEWADYLRQHISIEEIENDMKEAVTKGVQFALSEKANHLPGWTGLEVIKNLKPNFVERINNGKKKAVNFNIIDNIETAKANTSNTKPIKFKG